MRVMQPSSDCAADRDRPSPVFSSATPAIASGASNRSPSVSANIASEKGCNQAGIVIGGSLRAATSVPAGCVFMPPLHVPAHRDRQAQQLDSQSANHKMPAQCRIRKQDQSGNPERIPWASPAIPHIS